ncbi:nuclear transport factor 2 family protein [Sediminihaliea albiluteola]|nr:nuclear transport factor 2 family protein [Sediminihaliea albiluteola]
MMLSLQEISDQLQIQQNLWDYANAVDMKDFDLLDQVFLPDAEIFYGDQWFNREQAKQWLRESLHAEQIGGYYHLR